MMNTRRRVGGTASLASSSTAHSTFPRRRKSGVGKKSGTCSLGVLVVVFFAVVLLLTPLVLLIWSLRHTDQIRQQRAEGSSHHHVQQPHVPNTQRAPGDKFDGGEVYYDQPGDTTKYHVLFSTDCTDYHHWQSYVFFYWAWKVGQPGTITRIASGCTAKQEKEAEDEHYHHIEQAMGRGSGRFKIHFTPDYTYHDGQNKQRFAYYNKPFGVRHWMEHVLGFPRKEDDDDAVIILMDPDMILTRPITRYFHSDSTIWHGNHSYDFRVDHGKPVAQQYLLGTDWIKWNLTGIGLKASSIPSIADAAAHYQVGPPYVATARDMYAIARRWTDLSTPVHELYPNMLAEMLAYVVAAADLGLPHELSNSFMYSDARVDYTEPWTWVEQIEPKEKLCSKDLISPHSSSSRTFANVLHYCQPYQFQEYEFYKLHLRGKINKCNHPLLKEPSVDMLLGNQGNGQNKSPFDWSSHHPLLLEARAITKQDEWAVRTNQRIAFMTCQLTFRLNEAMEHQRLHACHKKHDKPGNTERSFLSATTN